MNVVVPLVCCTVCLLAGYWMGRSDRVSRADKAKELAREVMRKARVEK